MELELYPLKFHPILKEKIWGGSKLNLLLNKNNINPNIGESWEISDVQDQCSIVSNGPLKGTTLKELLSTYRDKLIGDSNFNLFGETFPLLIKFIDAREDLSIQLHPNDELAAKRHNSFGKTEMWYVMQADDNANLIVGFKQKLTPDIYLKHLEDKTLTKILNIDKVLIDKYSVVSSEVAKAMAIQVQKLFKTDYAIATTGNAGPTKGDSDAEVGTVFIAIANKNKVYSEKFMLGNHRSKVINKAVNKAFEMLLKEIFKN